MNFDEFENYIGEAERYGTVGYANLLIMIRQSSLTDPEKAYLIGLTYERYPEFGGYEEAVEYFKKAFYCGIKRAGQELKKLQSRYGNILKKKEVIYLSSYFYEDYDDLEKREHKNLVQEYLSKIPENDESKLKDTIDFIKKLIDKSKSIGLKKFYEKSLADLKYSYDEIVLNNGAGISNINSKLRSLGFSETSETYKTLKEIYELNADELEEKEVKSLEEEKHRDLVKKEYLRTESIAKIEKPKRIKKEEEEINKYYNEESYARPLAHNKTSYESKTYNSETDWPKYKHHAYEIDSRKMIDCHGVKKEDPCFNNAKEFLNRLRSYDARHFYSNSFWHITSLNNLLKILKDGKFLARKFNDHIPDDNFKNNETTHSVMNTNRSTYIYNYVRLYFNPINAVSFSFKYTNKFVALVEVYQDILWRSDNPILISPGSAHYLDDFDYQWNSRCVNRHYCNVEPYIEFLNSDVEHLYTDYDKYDDKNNKLKEVLVYKSLSTRFIRHIYFTSYDDMNKFLSYVKNLDTYDRIQKICKVDYNVFR